MEEQIVTTIETTIAETDKSHGTASVGDDVYIYRRLADRYDKTAIAMLNAEAERKKSSRTNRVFLSACKIGTFSCLARFFKPHRA